MSSVLADLNWERKRRRYIIQLFDQGLTKRHIAKQLMMTQSHVARVIAEAKKKRTPK